MKIMWTKEKIDILKRNYGKMYSGHLASILKITKYSVNSKAYKLGLSKPHTDTGIDFELLDQLYNSHKVETTKSSKIKFKNRKELASQLDAML